jgi:hypothetical protein
MRVAADCSCTPGDNTCAGNRANRVYPHRIELILLRFAYARRDSNRAGNAGFQPRGRFEHPPGVVYPRVYPGHERRRWQQDLRIPPLSQRVVGQHIRKIDRAIVSE